MPDYYEEYLTAIDEFVFRFLELTNAEGILPKLTFNHIPPVKRRGEPVMKIACGHNEVFVAYSRWFMDDRTVFDVYRRLFDE